MAVQITAFYAALTGFLMLVLAYRVVGFRRLFKAGMGDSDDHDFQVAIRAHANLIEYAPLTLILLLCTEASGMSVLWMHVLGAAFFLSRLAHAWGFLVARGAYHLGRFCGTLLNWILIAVLSVINMIAIV